MSVWGLFPARLCPLTPTHRAQYPLPVGRLLDSDRDM